MSLRLRQPIKYFCEVFACVSCSAAIEETHDNKH